MAQQTRAAQGGAQTSPREWWPLLTLDRGQGMAGSGLRRPAEPLRGPWLAVLMGWGVSLECGPSMDRNPDPWLSQSDRDCQETTVSNFCSRQDLKDPMGHDSQYHWSTQHLGHERAIIIQPSDWSSQALGHPRVMVIWVPNGSTQDLSSMSHYAT